MNPLNVLRGNSVMTPTHALARDCFYIGALGSRKTHAKRGERLKALLHQSPRQFSKVRSTWTLALAAEVCLEQGVRTERVSIETIRDALKRRGVRWQRGKSWITSPDPQYALNKTGVTV